MKALEINSLEFVGHTITADSMLQQDTHACDEQILYAGDIAKTVVASAAVGMTERAIGLAVDHANEREQFGQKLAQFQAIQWKIADMSADSAAARLLVYKAAWCKDEEPESLRKRSRDLQMVRRQDRPLPHRRGRPDNGSERALRRLRSGAVLSRRQSFGALRGHIRVSKGHIGTRVGHLAEFSLDSCFHLT